jgi:hypothetical protein
VNGVVKLQSTKVISMQKSNSYRTYLGFLLILITIVFMVWAMLVSWVLCDRLGPAATPEVST